MSEWNVFNTGNFLNAYKWYEKKRSNELVAVLNNLDTYFKALQEVKNPLQVTGGYIHSEPDGIIAIDQKGGKQKVKLEQTRLYIYPDSSELKLYLLGIGNKSSQSQDIQTCREIVKQLMKNKGGQ